MPFLRPTLDSLRRDNRSFIEARLPGAQPSLRHNLLGTLSDAQAGLAHLQMGYLDWILRQVIPATAEGEFIDRHLAMLNEQRKPPAQASGTVRFTGTSGTVIDSGTQLSAQDGMLFRTISVATLSAGIADVSVMAVEGGADGNLPTGTKLNMTTAVPGIFNIAEILTPGFTGGESEEEDDEARARLIFRLSNPPQGGSASDYVSWALAVPGVTRAWAYPLNRGAGTVDVAFVMDGRPDIIPTTIDIATVQDYIDVRRPVTANVIVFAPVPVALNVVLSDLSPNTTIVRAAVQAEIAAQIRLDAVPGGTIRRSRLTEAISRASGEGYHTISSPSADVDFEFGEIAVPGSVTFP